MLVWKQADISLVRRVTDWLIGVRNYSGDPDRQMKTVVSFKHEYE